MASNYVEHQQFGIHLRVIYIILSFDVLFDIYWLNDRKIFQHISLESSHWDKPNDVKFVFIRPVDGELSGKT